MVMGRFKGVRQIPAVFSFALALLCAGGLNAQEGHPLTGSWSGEAHLGDRPSRVLLVLERSAQRIFSGYVLLDRTRMPVESVTLDPEGWRVTITAKPEGEGAGEFVVEGVIENLGSAIERTIAGTARLGDREGDFRAVIN